LWEATSPIPPFIVCHSGEREISIAAELLRDLRRLKKDRTTYKPAYNGVSMVNVRFEASPTCSLALSQDVMTLDVTEARGQEAATIPYVTSDYWRHMTVQIEASAEDASCGSVSLVANLTLEQATSDFVTRQLECGCL
jgi:hypothetical protein